MRKRHPVGPCSYGSPSQLGRDEPAGCAICYYVQAFIVSYTACLLALAVSVCLASAPSPTPGNGFFEGEYHG